SSPMHLFAGYRRGHRQGRYIGQLTDGVIKEILTYKIYAILDGRAFHNERLLQVKAGMLVQHEIQLATDRHRADHQNYRRGKLEDDQRSVEGNVEDSRAFRF